jgi:CRISPR-associated protein Cmr5
MQTIQQQRAAHALSAVNTALKRENGIVHLSAKQAKEFRSYVCAMPAMIHMNGLGQAAAFYRSKKSDDMHRKVYALLSDWLCAGSRPYADYPDLLDGITASGRAQYQLAQAETQAFMSWVVKFTKAFAPDETPAAKGENDETAAA